MLGIGHNLNRIGHNTKLMSMSDRSKQDLEKTVAPAKEFLTYV